MLNIETEAAFPVRPVKSAIHFTLSGVEKSAYRIGREAQGQGQRVK
jgi:hypothetical protein